MTAEKKPIDRIDAKIASQKVVISDLGVIKSKVAALQDALTVFEDITMYGNMSARRYCRFASRHTPAGAISRPTQKPSKSPAACSPISRS